MLDSKRRDKLFAKRRERRRQQQQQVKIETDGRCMHDIPKRKRESARKDKLNLVSIFQEKKRVSFRPNVRSVFPFLQYAKRKKIENEEGKENCRGERKRNLDKILAAAAAALFLTALAWIWRQIEIISEEPSFEMNIDDATRKID